jgi:uncharacterized protein (DUF1778 family)
MKAMVAIRMDSKLKKFLQEMAERDQRSLTSFLTNAAIVYAKEKLGFDWHEKKTKE